MGTSSQTETEQILKESRNVLYYMQAGGREPPIRGQLILTNLRIAFVEVSARKGLLPRRRKETLRPILNYRVTRLIRANTETRQKTSEPMPGKPIVTETQQVLVINLNTPTGTESFTFEVEDPEQWCQVINGFAPAELERIPSKEAPVAAPAQSPEASAPERIPQPKTSSTDLKKFCPECGKELDIDTKFCWECGTPQPET